MVRIQIRARKCSFTFITNIHTFVRVVITNFLDSITNNLLIIHNSLGCDLATHKNHTSLGNSFCSHKERNQQHLLYTYTFTQQNEHRYWLILSHVLLIKFKSILTRIQLGSCCPHAEYNSVFVWSTDVSRD